MIPLAVPNLRGNERAYLNQCIDTEFVSSVGAFVTRLEGMGAEVTHSVRSVAVSSGTAALQLALLSQGVLSGDMVAVPSFTFIASVNSISHCGAVPWFMDIDGDSWTLDPFRFANELGAKTKKVGDDLIHIETGRRVAAVMPVYTLGNTADMDAINGVAAEFGIPVIADAACALGARYKGKAVGDLADVSAISLNGNKTITAGGGGLVVANDAKVMDFVKHISTTARTSPEYDFDMVGFNYRMTNLQAAVACAQMERLQEFVDKKRFVRSFYQHAFEGLPAVSPFPVPSWCDSACWFSGLVIEEADHAFMVELCEKLKDDGIEARTFWKPVHMQPPYFKAPRADDLTVTESIWSKVLTLPCSTGITLGELEFVAESVKKELGY